jgi:ribosomal protein L11 methyltransferase
MGYYEFNIKVSEDSTDALIERLAGIGCLGIIASGQALVVYFPDAMYVDIVKKELAAFKTVLQRSGLPNELSFDHLYISERDWNESWKQKFQPIDVGDKLAIIPPWLQPKPERINLIIDPGMAFGTGHHETTMRCLMLIEKNSCNMVKKNKFLDIGTGTGILAIAASKLGFSEVVGVDIDPLAIEAAKRNVKSNNLDNVTILCERLIDIELNFDFIAANLLANVLIELGSEITRRLNKGGIILLSGIIEGQELDVIKVYESCGAHFNEKIIDGKWVTLIGSLCF